MTARPAPHRASTPLVPRVFAILRPTCAQAVIVRRGPTMMSATFGWDLARGEIRLGQMMRARMSPFHADLSDDGAQLYYHAYDGRHVPDPATEGGYGVLARAPYLKAVKSWTRQSWDSARLFDRRGVLHKGDYRARLVRDGWALTRVEPGTLTFRKSIDGHAWIEKTHHDRRLSWDRPRYRDQHAIIDRHGEPHEQDGWDWADVRDGRLYWTSGGLLQVSPRIGAAGAVTRAQVVYDFRALRFQRIEAPY